MKRILSWNREKFYLEAYGGYLDCSCDVRNLENGRREKNEIVRTIPDSVPYSPQQFPVGVWEIGEIEEKTDPYLAPFFINTDAWQWVLEWEIKDGLYIKRTDKWVKDTEYGIHYSTSPTTLGCLKIIKEADLIWLVEKIRESKDNGETVYIAVTDGGNYDNYW